MTRKIDLIDLSAQQLRIRDRINAAIDRVLDHGKYILGPEVEELEQKLSDFTGAEHVVTCANGTDALSLIMMAEGIGRGDAVFVPSFTFVATAEIVPRTGAMPILVDVERDTFNLDPESLKLGLKMARSLRLRPKAIIAVDLFGLPANYPVLREIAASEGIILISDAAQSFGAEIQGARTGTFADYTTTSFFPAKPLGCYGDGGAVITMSNEKADLLRSLRFHGKGNDKYDNVRLGLNSRLDTLQAAILIEKLSIFEDEMAARNKVAQTYRNGLSSFVEVPTVPDGYKSAWAQYTIVSERRDEIATACRQEGISTAVYYPLPTHRQTGYKSFLRSSNVLPISDILSQTVVSLPMHPYLETENINFICDVVSRVFKK